MNSYLIALLVVFVFVAIAFISAYASRLGTLKRMNSLLTQAQKCADKAQSLINEHGNSVGELERAGVYTQLIEFEDEGGKFYRQAVSLAASLVWWIGPSFKEKMRKGYDTVGYFTDKRARSYEAYEDVKRGFASDTHYYYPQHLLGLTASLRTIGLFG